MDVDGSVCVYGWVSVCVEGYFTIVQLCDRSVWMWMGQFVCVDTCMDECVGGCVWLCGGSVFGYNACIAITNCDLDTASELNKHEI